MIKTGDYIVAVRDMNMKNSTHERIVTKGKKYKVLSSNYLYFTFDDDLGIRANFDNEHLNENSVMYLFDTPKNLRIKKIKSML